MKTLMFKYADSMSGYTIFMVRIVLLFLSTILLGGCSPSSAPVVEEQASDMLGKQTQITLTKNTPHKPLSALEQVPLELSIEYFSKMQLEGTGLTLSSVIERNDAYTRYAIEYLSNGLVISGIMNIPKGDGPFPLVILNHGFISPTVYTRGRGLKREQDYLARRGFAVLHSDYRGHAESDPSPDTRNVYDAGLEYSMDVVNAIQAVRSANLSMIDTSRVGMLGHSLGGGVTLNIMTAYPTLVDAAVLYAPVHADAWENFVRWRDIRDEGDHTRAFLGTREEKPDNWDRLSSQTYLQYIDDPVLLFHGTNDADVPKEWSDDLARRLTDLGKDIEYVEYEGEKHEFIPQWNDFMKRAAVFFDTHLRRADEKSRTLLLHPDRITKKPFGMHITRESSPVQPERFSGFHTGTDFELFENEEASDLYVSAICTGKIREKAWIPGYGGLLIQDCMIDEKPMTVLYGHLSLASIGKEADDVLMKEEIIGHPGEAYSNDTDGERAHLHLAIHKGGERELRGYVQTKEELNTWMNPFYEVLSHE
jgi:uncharacterized protein